MKFKLLEGKALTALIAGIGKARVQLDGEVQTACLHVIGQSIVHRNATPANALLEVVSKHHKATIVAYLERFGNLAWDRKADKLGFREVHAADKLHEVIDRLRKAVKKGITIVNAPVLREVEAAYNAAMVKAYGEGDKSAQQLAIDGALDARSKGLATPAQLKMLAEHFGKPVTQFTETPSAKQEAVEAEARKVDEFGAPPALVVNQ
jgi:hypothetical protein